MLYSKNDPGIAFLNREHFYTTSRTVSVMGSETEAENGSSSDLNLKERLQDGSFAEANLISPEGLHQAGGELQDKGVMTSQQHLLRSHKHLNESAK